MARSKVGVPISDYSAKKGIDEVPVAPCPGWTDDCEFCEKRLGKWEEANEDVLDKIPHKPGIFAIALRNKNVTEVVDICIDTSGIQKAACISIEQVRSKISDKKSKVTKSVILCRWMTFKQPKEKDVVNLCAHWCNTGVLPKYMEDWPGSDILQNTDTVEFSERLQKWCYPKKDTFWKKPKVPPTKEVSMVEGCVWNQTCTICDSYFFQWRKLDDVVLNFLAPQTGGIYMIGVQYGKRIEIINVCFEPTNIVLYLSDSIRESRKSLNDVVKNRKYLNTNTTFLVRWIEMSTTETNMFCYLYAHWLNSERMPEMNLKLPGEKHLDRHKSWVLRNEDKKWGYEMETFKHLKRNTDTKKQIMKDLEDEYRNLNCDED